MSKKFFILSLSFALLFVFSASISPVIAKNRSIPINWRVAGGLVDVTTWSGKSPMQVVVFLKAKGSPGRADLTIMGYVNAIDSDDNCEKIYIFGGDDFVAVFNDLSMLFAQLNDEGASYVCSNEGQPSTFFFDMKITGGTGRFEGATGYFEATGVSRSNYLSGDTGLGAEFGNFIGEIVFED